MNPFVFSRISLSLGALLVLFSSDNLIELGILAVVLTVVYVGVRGLQPLFRLTVAVLLMAVPLFLIHSIVNPMFSVSTSFVGIPLRGEGAAYAALVSLRLTYLFLAVAVWIDTPRDVAFSLIAKLPGPPLAGFALMQALMMTHMFSRRVSNIQLAQKSRGLLGTGIASKMRNTLSMIVPLIATTLMNAHERGNALAQLGFGSARLLAPRDLPRPNPADIGWAFVVLAAVLFALLFGGSDENL